VADLKKRGQSGSDVPTPREALYSRMRKRGNGTDGPESPKAFSNEIRTAIITTGDKINLVAGQTAPLIGAISPAGL